jgi:tripartite-type tricarboxylate transporter receptor subunit TctC
MITFKPVLAGLALAAVLAQTSASASQTYPTRTITIVTAGPAGGPTDAIARAMSNQLGSTLGQSVVIENLPSSGGIYLRRVARAAPDGYTIGLGHWGSHVVDGAALSLPVDIIRDFEPIALLATTPMMITSRTGVPTKTLRELVDWLKANPNSTIVSTGAGSPPAIAGHFFQKLAGVTLRFVPYRGGAPAMQDLVAGHVDLFISQAGFALAQAQSGTIRAYAVMAPARLRSAPELPTVDEAGVQGLHLAIWHALFAPKGVSSDVLDKLNGAVVSSLEDPGIRKRLEGLGQDIPARDQLTRPALRALQEFEIEKWWPIIKAAGIKGE